MPAVKTYDPAKCTLIIGGKIIQGFADGTVISIERDEDMWQYVTGTDGQGTRAKSNNYAGKVTITLFQSSSSNDDLSQLAAIDELTGQGAVPMLFRDASGRTVASASTMWITKYATSEFAKTVSDRTWVLQTDYLNLFTGGN